MQSLASHKPDPYSPFMCGRGNLWLDVVSLFQVTSTNVKLGEQGFHLVQV